jgi:DNA repair protein RadC
MASSPHCRSRPPAKQARRRIARQPALAATTHDAVGLCSRPYEVDGADTASAAAPAPPADRARCRALLGAMLAPAWPGDAGRWADALIAEFGSLPEALAAGAPALARRTGPGPAAFLLEVRAAWLHCLLTPLAGRPIVSTSKQLLDYLRADMANLTNERFRVLFLTSQNELMADDLIWDGTVGEAPAYPREVVRRALEVGATGVILVHNHPSGSHQPSPGDIEATRRIADAAAVLGICVHDHIVISRAGWASFRRMGLLDPAPAGTAN